MLKIFPMSRTIGIAGQRGGTGKTVTAVNLAASLALSEKRTLLVDCDPQGTATHLCGINADELKVDLASVFTARANVEDAIVPTQLSYLDLIPSGINLFGAGMKLSRNPGNEKILRLFIKDIEDEYDYIVIDCPSSVSFMSVCAMAASQSLLVCMDEHRNSYEDFHFFLSMVKYIHSSLSVAVKVAGLLFLRCPGKASVDQFLARQGLEEVKEIVFNTVIPEDPAVRQSIEKRCFCPLYDIKSPASQAYLLFANELDSFLNH